MGEILLVSGGQSTCSGWLVPIAIFRCPRHATRRRIDFRFGQEVPVGEIAFIFAVVRIAVELDATEAGHGGIATVGRLELRFEPRAGTDPGHREPLGAKLRTAVFPRAVATAFFARVLCVFTRVYDTNVLTSTAAAAALGGAAAAAGRRRRTVWILRGAPGEA